MKIEGKDRSVQLEDSGFAADDNDTLEVVDGVLIHTDGTKRTYYFRPVQVFVGRTPDVTVAPKPR